MNIVKDLEMNRLEEKVDKHILNSRDIIPDSLWRVGLVAEKLDKKI